MAQRHKELGAYLQELCACPDAEKNPHILHFFGLEKIDDPVSLEIETRAIAATLSELGLGGVVYEDVSDAMSKIVIIKIKEEMWTTIVESTPPSEKARKAALKAANKSLDSIVGPIVETGVRGAKDASAPVRKKLMEKLVEVGVTAVQAKHDVQNKLKEAMSSALSPIVGALSQLIGLLGSDLLPVILRPLVPTLQAVGTTGEKLIDVFAQGDESKVDELRKALLDTINGLGEKINESMKDAIANLVGDRDKLIANPALQGVMALLELIVDIVKDIILVVFNVDPWFDSLVHMMRWKAEMLKADPSNADAVYSLCDKQQDDMEDTIDNNGDQFMMGASTILCQFQALPGKAGLLSTEVGALFDDLRGVVHDSFYKRFAKKFSDYLWGTLNLASDKREWKEKVEHSFALAFRSAVRRAIKGISKIAVVRIVGILETPILAAIQENVNPMIRDALEPINNALPEAVKDFIDVEGMVNSVIEETVHDSCTRIVKDQENVFKQAFSVNVGYVYGAPFLPSYPPFPYVYVTTPGGAVIVPVAAAVPSAPVAAAAAADPSASAVMEPAPANPAVMTPVEPAPAAAAAVAPAALPTAAVAPVVQPAEPVVAPVVQPVEPVPAPAAAPAPAALPTPAVAQPVSPSDNNAGPACLDPANLPPVTDEPVEAIVAAALTENV